MADEGYGEQIREGSQSAPITTKKQIEEIAQGLIDEQVEDFKTMWNDGVKCQVKKNPEPHLSRNAGHNFS